MYPQRLVDHIAQWMNLAISPAHAVIIAYFDIFTENKPPELDPFRKREQRAGEESIDESKTRHRLPLPGGCWADITVRSDERKRWEQPRNAVETFSMRYQTSDEYRFHVNEKEIRYTMANQLARALVHRIYDRAFETWAREKYTNLMHKGEIFAVVERER